MTTPTGADADAAQERARILALIDLDQDSRFSPATRAAIADGTSAGDFAIALMNGKARGRAAVETAARLGHPGFAHLKSGSDQVS